MAQIQYTSVPESDFSFGIDVRNAENQIAPGFVRDLLNADIVEKRARKRQGHQGFAGNVPVRVTELEYDQANNEICFILPQGVSLQSSGVSLETTPPSPIVVYGRSSSFTAGQGPFTTSGDHVRYYSTFTVPLRKTLLTGTHTLNYPQAEHGETTTNLFVGVVESTSLTDRSYEDVEVNKIRLDESSYDINIDYINGTSSNKDALIYLADKSPVAGSSYVHAALAVGTGVQTISIPASTHNLSDFNITVQIQQDTGTERQIVTPDSFLIATNGDVTVGVTNSTGSPLDYYVILSAAPIANNVNGVVNGLSTGTVTIPAVSSPWVFYAIYLEQTPGGTKELVQPDSIIYSDTTKNVTISFTNGSSSARNFIVYYEYGVLRSNKLCVTDNTLTTSGTDTRPQLTIWGLEHDEIYPSSKSEREGWVNHIDSYRRSGEQRLICGLGGNLFSARTYSEAATQYAYAQLYPRLNARASANRILGPLFWDTNDSPARTRGYITSDDSGTHWATITAVQYDTGNGWTKYTISLPSKAVLDSTGTPTTLGSVLSTTTGLEDYLTVQGMSYARHEGVFRIRQVLDGTNEIFVWVENSSNSADYDDSGVAGEVGVFSDQLVWSSSAPFIAGDMLLSAAIPDTLEIETMLSSSTTTVSDGWVDRIEVPGGVLFLGRRQSSVLPLRSGYPAAASAATNLVRGDMLSYSGPDRLNSKTSTARLMRVKSINADSDRTADISVTGDTATVTMTSGDTAFLTKGNQVLIIQAGTQSGIHTIDDILSSTEFTYTTSVTDSATGATLVGHTAEIDESLDWEDTIGDTNGFTVVERWIPIEAPDDLFDLTPSTYVTQLDYSTYVNQAFLRSTMVVDNMYLTDGNNEVFKFDGSNIYRAGILPWQPGLFINQDTTASAKIVTSLRSLAYSASDATTGKLTISAADQNIIPVGSTVHLSGSTEHYTVQSYTQDDPIAPTAFYLLVERALDTSVSASGTVSEIGIFRYYFRLNAVDANSNIIASAVTGYQDHVIELTADAAIQLKLVGLPNWDIYDFDRLEVQIYRTKMNTAAPFYRITTLPLDFDNTQGYLTFTDSFADSDLTDLDEVNTALKGQELGTAWSDPLRAKYVTSIANRLVLGNLRDYPQFDIQVVGPASISNSDFFNDSILFRRDHTDTGTDTDMPNRVRYEWIHDFSGPVAGFAPGVNHFLFNTINPTGAHIGDWIYLTYATVSTTTQDSTYAGWWQIAAISGSIVQVNLVGAAAAASYPNRFVVASNTADVPVLMGTDGNLGMVNGDSFPTFNAMRRMSMAINATMRMVDTSLTGMGSFTPWLVARSGNDTPPAGRLIVRQPRSDATAMEMVPSFSGYDLFVNSVRRATLDEIGASSRTYPSRILASYENYSEIFDNPTSILDTDSDSAIDINPADGQEITGIIPFFGQTAFTAAQQAAVLVVFKTNSIYLVDLNQKKLGNQCVQRIETEGLGCTAPYSITASKNGIPFANESGMYILRRNQAIEYVGRFMERNWTERVDLDALSLAQGHHFGVGRAYKLSVPITATQNETTGYLENSEVYVYNHTGEDQGRPGAWGRYDNHPATGWANLAANAYFAATSGRVFSIRQEDEISDYRDDSSGIDMTLTSRAADMGAPGIRKVVDGIIIDYRVGARNTGTSLAYSVDLEQEFSTSTPFVVPKPPASTNLSDPIPQDVVPIRHDIQRRRGVYFASQISNSTIDENVEIAGITYKVGGLSDKGILQAARTK